MRTSRHGSHSVFKFLSRGFEYERGMCKAACNNGVSVIKALQVWCKPGALCRRMYKVYLLYVIRYSSNLLHAESYCSISHVVGSACTR